MEPQIFGLPLVPVVLVGILLICAALYFIVDRIERRLPPPASPPTVELNWLVARDDALYKDNEVLVKDNRFMERVARVIEAKTKCQTSTDRDLIRVYKKNKLIGIVKCCEVGRNATPGTVRELVELAEHLRVQTMYLAASGPVPLDTQRFAALQKVKVISV